MKSRGFSIVELVIVITIMGILMSLATVTFIGTKANARDSERKADVQSIALHLEIYYRNNGKYPSTVDLGSNPRTLLIDIDEKSLNGPELSGATQPLNYSTDTSLPTATMFNNDQYVYQPLAYNNTSGTWELCVTAGQECRKFNLYTWLKGDDGKLYTVTSKNQ